MTSPGITAIDICICTYRRPHIVDTLRSVAALTLDDKWQIRVIVADNDKTTAAKPFIEAALIDADLDSLYIHAPEQNISIARNACLDVAKAALVAFIDDDEIVSPQWLSEMMKTLQETRADAVMGPVNALYRPSAPSWIRNGNFHSTLPVMTDGKIVTGGSGNVLMRIDAPAIAGRRFRIDLGKSGGEDSEFFSAISRAGGHIAYAENAIVTEEVPDNRATMGWLIKRRLRYGQTHGLLLLATGSSGVTIRLRHALIAGGKALFSLCMALLSVIKPDQMRFWILRGALHTGVVMHLLGGDTLEIYGRDGQT